MQLLEAKITTDKNGWRHARFSTTSRATYGRREWVVSWRAVGHTCGEKTTDVPPVWEDDSYGELRSLVTNHTPDNHCYGRTQVVIRESFV
jgi:hypothetical protein